MKNLSAALVAMVLCFFSSCALAGDANYCENAAQISADAVVKIQKSAKYNKEILNANQLDVAKNQDYKGVSNRMMARSITLLDKTTLTPREIKADLYSLCMSLT